MFMENKTGKRFIDALERLERDGDVEPMVELFSDGCELRNLSFPHPFRGKGGAREFWRDYRGTFRNVRSEFVNRHECGEVVTLEWISKGTLRTGRKISYSGISVLELERGTIKAFRAYYDSAHLVEARAAKAA